MEVGEGRGRLGRTGKVGDGRGRSGKVGEGRGRLCRYDVGRYCKYVLVE